MTAGKVELEKTDAESFYEDHPRSDERNSRSVWSAGYPVDKLPPSISSALSGYNPIIADTMPVVGESNPGEKHQIFMPTKIVNDEQFLASNINYKHMMHCNLNSQESIIKTYQSYQALKSGSTSYGTRSSSFSIGAQAKDDSIFFVKFAASFQVAKSKREQTQTELEYETAKNSLVKNKEKYTIMKQNVVLQKLPLTKT